MDENVRCSQSSLRKDYNDDRDSEPDCDHALTRDGSSGSDLSLEQKKNKYLHYLLKSNVQARTSGLDDSPQCTDQLERTYRKALSDYRHACNKLTSHMTMAGKSAAELRSRLNEKEDKAEKQLKTLKKYREDIAQKSLFANGKQLGAQLEELESQDISDELERERLRFITNKVNVSQLEQKQKNRNELARGVSDIEFQNLEEAIHKSDDKIKCYDAEVKSMDSSGEKLIKLENFLTTAIQNYKEKNQSKESTLKELNEEIESKRSCLEHLNKVSKKVKKQIGYDASDIGEFLQTKMVNDDFSSSRDELDNLHTKLNELVIQRDLLAQQTER